MMEFGSEKVRQCKLKTSPAWQKKMGMVKFQLILSRCMLPIIVLGKWMPWSYAPAFFGRTHYIFNPQHILFLLLFYVLRPIAKARTCRKKSFSTGISYLTFKMKRCARRGAKEPSLTFGTEKNYGFQKFKGPLPFAFHSLGSTQLKSGTYSV